MIPETQMKALDANTIYFECCAGLGDTLLTCGYLKEIEKKHQCPIHLIVKKNHAFIPRMYGIEDAWVIEQDISLKQLKKYTTHVPTKGKIYAAHPCKHPELWDFFKPIYFYTSTERFMSWFKSFAGIPEHTKLELPVQYPVFSETVAQQLLKLAPMDQIVLFSPEATSVPALPMYFWEEKAETLSRQGYTVISNVINSWDTIAGTRYLSMSSSDVVALGMQCRDVYSVRSGLCDLLFSRGEHLHVYYPSHSTFFIYELNAMFRGHHICEEIVL